MKTFRFRRFWLLFACVTGLTSVLATATITGAAPMPTPPPRAPGPAAAKSDEREAKWLTNFANATGVARKDDKLILAYFRGSDWCPFCKKLDKEVLNTAPFIDWADKNVVLLDVDFPADKKQPPNVKQQNKALEERYGVIKTPTFVFLDPDGEPITRCGFDTAKLRDDEPKGQPKAFVQYLEEVVRTRPAKQRAIEQKTFTAGLKYAREHGLPLLVMLTQKEASEDAREAVRNVTTSQKFVRFINTHMAFVRATWPADDDFSLESLELLRWTHRQKVPVLPFQLVVWNPFKEQVTARIPTIDPLHIDPTLQRLRDVLPKIDYTGKWIEDYRLALAISAQTGRDVLMSFSSMDSSEWSQKLDKEVYQQEAFQDYARKNLVLLRLDFPKKTPQSAKTAEQNRLLAEAHGVRGYPTVIFINPRGQKFGEAKYMKGGPKVFLEALDQLRKADIDRRTILSDQFKPEDVK
jgi:thioredoxin-related protein